MTLRRTAIATLALVAITLLSAVPALADFNFAPEWRLADGLTHLVLPAAVPDSADGSVRVYIRVSSDGTVTYAKADQGPGSLKKPAEQAVRQWRYTELVDDDKKPIDVESYVYVVYTAADHLFYVQGPGGPYGGPAGAAFDLGPDGPAPGAPAGVVWHEQGSRARDLSAPSQLPVGVSGGVLAGKATEKPQPRYPQAARDQGVEGDVRVEMFVEKTGHVVSARPLDGSPLLQFASVDAARGWRFSPTTLQGQPVNVVGSVTFHFRRGR